MVDVDSRPRLDGPRPRRVHRRRRLQPRRHTLLVSGEQDGIVRLWDVDEGVTQLVLGGAASNVEHLTFHPSSQLPAAGSSPGTVLVWDVSPTGAGEILNIAVGDAPVVSAALGPDGRYLAGSDGEGHTSIWQAASGDLRPAQSGPERIHLGWRSDSDRALTVASCRVIYRRIEGALRAEAAVMR